MSNDYILELQEEVTSLEHKDDEYQTNTDNQEELLYYEITDEKINIKQNREGVLFI